jgi:two-component system, LytTR family, sensor kinase
MSARSPIVESDFLVRWVGHEISHHLLFWPLQAVGWLVYGIMMLGYALAHESQTQAIFDVVLLLATGYALTLGYRVLFRRWRRQRMPPFRLTVLVVVLCVVSAPLWYESQVLITRIAYSVRPSLVSALPAYGVIPLRVWFYWAFVLMAWALLYFSINGWVSLERARRRTAQAERLAQAARLEALQAQIQPHFLFNTLNSISALVVDGRLTAATDMIAKLSDFLRLSLQTSDTPQIALASELVFVRHYLDIQKIRFGERLTFTLDVAPAALSALVPTLLLQPLVENAVQHGILPHREGGTVSITVRSDARTLIMRVEDDGPGIKGSSSPAFGVGLSNVARRLEELYGDQSKLVIGRGAASGVVVSIELPLVATLEKSVEHAQEAG